MKAPRQTSKITLTLLVSSLFLGSCNSLLAVSSRANRESGSAVSVTCLTKKQKIVLLVGAAALAYLYNKHRNKKGVGANGQYYRSKNGHIYYRDARGGVHWVTPPAGGIRVPASEASLVRSSGY